MQSLAYEIIYWFNVRCRNKHIFVRTVNGIWWSHNKKKMRTENAKKMQGRVLKKPCFRPCWGCTVRDDIAWLHRNDIAQMNRSATDRRGCRFEAANKSHSLVTERWTLNDLNGLCSLQSVHVQNRLVHVQTTATREIYLCMFRVFDWRICDSPHAFELTVKWSYRTTVHYHKSSSRSIRSFMLHTKNRKLSFEF